MLIQRMDKRFEEFEKKPETKATATTRRSGLSNVFKTAGQVLSVFVETTV